MSGEGSWRSADYVERFKTHDHADFAQEFLRRNPDYREDFAETELRIASAPHTAQIEREGLARRWGLSFPLQPGKIRKG